MKFIPFDDLPELRDAARDARFDGAYRHSENYGDLLVWTIFQIEKRHGRLINFVNFGQRAQHFGAIHRVNRFGRLGGQRFRAF